jgi:hypothetical protein
MEADQKGSSDYEIATRPGHVENIPGGARRPSQMLENLISNDEVEMLR